MSIYADMYVTYMSYMTEYRSLWSHMGQQWVPTWIIFGSYESNMGQPWYVLVIYSIYGSTIGHIRVIYGPMWNNGVSE